MSAEIQNAADALRHQVTDKIQTIKSDPRMVEVIRAVKALNALEDLLGQRITSLSAFFALDGGESPAASAVAAILIDEFVNLSPLEAAKRYLSKVGRPARRLDEIISGIKSGGGDVPNKSALRTQLGRSGDVKSVGEDVFGLAEWYPKKRGRPVGSTAGSSNDDEDAGDAAEGVDADEGEEPLAAAGGGEPAT